MKFTISTLNLTSHLQSVSKVIASKNTLHILDCILFEVNDKGLTLTASDGENVVVTTTELIEHDADARFCISAKNIIDTTREMPEQPLEFTVDLDTLAIDIDYLNGNCKLVAQSADEYPTLPEMASDATELTVPADALLAALNRTHFAAASDDLHPVMNSVFFDIDENFLALVATDGRKLACDKLNSVHASQKSTFILPKKPAGTIRQLLPKETGDVSIRFNATNAEFTMQNYKMYCRLAEGRYPNYRAVLPKGNPFRVTLDTASLVSALRRMLVFASSVSLVKLSISDDRLTLSAQDNDFNSSAVESVKCDYQGAPLEIGFKGVFLLEIMQNIDFEQISLVLADPSRPGIIVPSEQKNHIFDEEAQHPDEEVLMLLMPMML